MSSLEKVLRVGTHTGAPVGAASYPTGASSRAKTWTRGRPWRRFAVCARHEQQHGAAVNGSLGNATVYVAGPGGSITIDASAVGLYDTVLTRT